MQLHEMNGRFPVGYLSYVNRSQGSIPEPLILQ